jgi:uncharacterized protein (DUF433 family)
MLSSELPQPRAFFISIRESLCHPLSRKHNPPLIRDGDKHFGNSLSLHYPYCKKTQLLYNARGTGVIVSTCGGEKMAGKKNSQRRIVIDPKVHFGKPCIAGTRIPVEDVLELIQENISFTKIVERYYPDLEIEDIKACVRYATDLVRSEEIHAELA